MCTRTGLGLFVGYVSLIAYGMSTIGCIFVLADKTIISDAASKNSDISPGFVRDTVIVFLVVCSTMTLISGLLVSGIVKRRHKYMKPWLVLAAVSIVICAIVALIDLFKGGERKSRAFSVMGGIALQCFIFYPIHTLYKDIREENAILIQRT